MRVFVALVSLASVLAVALVLHFIDRPILDAARAVGAPSVPPGGEITLVLDDFRFTPNTLVLPAGAEVRIRLVNRGRHTHEFMVGREVHLEENVFEPPTPDFFEGLEVEVLEVRGTAMVMGMPGMEEEEMEMGMGEMGMEMMDVPPGAHPDMVMFEDHPQGMVMLAPGAEVVLRVRVPEDARGVWVFGCFQEEGLHFDAGMFGTLVVR